jgi:hypothetical protein
MWRTLASGWQPAADRLIVHRKRMNVIAVQAGAARALITSAAEAGSV